MLIEIEKYQQIPLITFRAMINLRGKVPNRVVLNKKCPLHVKTPLFVKLDSLKNDSIDLFDILNLKLRLVEI